MTQYPWMLIFKCKSIVILIWLEAEDQCLEMNYKDAQIVNDI